MEIINQPKPKPLRRWIAVIVCMVEMFLFSNTLYGFNSLIPIYTSHGVFQYKCQGQVDNNTMNTAETNTSSVQTFSLIPCAEQLKMFSTAFMSHALIDFGAAFPIGFLFDKIGIRATKTMAGVCFLLGSLCYGLASPDIPYLVFPAGILYAFSGQFLIVCNMQIGQVFPKYQNFLRALACGFINGSNIPFSLIYLGHKVGISFLALFCIFGGIGFVSMTMSAFLLMKNTPEEMLRLSHKYDGKPQPLLKEDLNGTIESPKTDSFAIEFRAQQQKLNARYPTLRSCMCNWIYVFHCIFMGLIGLRLVNFLTGLSHQLTTKFGPESPSTHNLLVQINYFMFSGIILSPLGGIIVDFFRLRCVPKATLDAKSHEDSATNYFLTLRPLIPLTLLCSVSDIVLSCLLLGNNETVFYFAFTFLTLMRSAGSTIGTINIMTAFPLQNYGSLYGFYNLVSVFFIASQCGFLELGQSNLLAINYIFIATALLTMVYPLYIIKNALIKK